MFGNTFGRIFRITTSGESYSGGFRKHLDIPKELFGGLLTIVDGVPSGIKISPEFIQAELDKRRPGQSELDTPRKEKDNVYIFSGIMEDFMTTGAPIGLIIPNNDIEDVQIEKHRSYKDVIRPGQAAFTYHEKYGEHADTYGAGRASGRETAARVAGGAIAKAVLDSLGIDVIAFVSELHGIKAAPMSYENVKANYRKNELNCPDLEKSNEMISQILKLKTEGDTCGGVIEIIAKGVPAGLGEPVFDKLSATIAHGLMSIGAVKGIEFGAGFKHTEMKGSESNDVPYIDPESGKVKFKTNNAGGLLGGISNGEEIRIRVAVKATPTISKMQNTINIKEMENITCEFKTRNDPSICPRIYPVCEAMVRIAILDALYMAKGYRSVCEDLESK